MMAYLPPFLSQLVEMVADMYHQIDQAFSIFLVCFEKYGIEGLGTCMRLVTPTMLVLNACVLPCLYYVCILYSLPS